MAGKQKSAPRLPTLSNLLNGAPRVLARIIASGEYMGPCIVQAPGGWARIGPTWHVPGLGWVVVGPGINRWNTTMGLAEIATVGCATTTWHADGVSVAPQPNIVYSVLRVALDSGHVARCAELAAQAEGFVSRNESGDGSCDDDGDGDGESQEES